MTASTAASNSPGPLNVSAPILVAVIAALLAVVLLVDLPSRPRIWAVLGNAAHAPAFGTLALVALALLRQAKIGGYRTRLVIALALSVGAGVAVEWLQGLIGRDSSWADVVTDLLGATTALGLAVMSPRLGPSAPTARSRNAASIVVLISVMVVLHPIVLASAAYAWRENRFPVLASFASPLDLYFGESTSARVERTKLPQSPGHATSAQALRVESTGGRWPGWAHTEPVQDWTRYEALKVSVQNPGEHRISVVIRVHDRDHDQRFTDRYNRGFAVEPASRRTITLSLTDIAAGPVGREMNLREIAGIIVFSPRLPAGEAFYLEKIWLE